jgi:hypothetical protein
MPQPPTFILSRPRANRIARRQEYLISTPRWSVR